MTGLALATSTSAPVASPAEERMAPVDCAWLRMDHAANLMVINGVWLFDAPLERERLLRTVERRLASVKRFRQRAVCRRGRWYWQDVPGLDAAAHLVEDRLPPGSGERELRALVSAEMERPLPPDRPLWKAHLVHGYDGGSAVLIRLHHCMGDGIALMVLMLAITDLEPSADLREAPGTWGSENPLADLFGDEPLSPREALRHLEELMPEGAKLLARPAEMAAAVPRWLRGLGQVPSFAKMSLRWPDPRTRLKGALGGSKRVAWSRPVSLDQVRRAKQAVGGTVNDVLLTAISGGLRRYLEAKGDRTDRLALRAVVPVSLRPLTRMQDLGNCFGLVFLPLCVGERVAARRLHHLQRRLKALRHSFEPLTVLTVLGLLGRSPRWLQDLVLRIFGTKGTAVLTSVPGPSRPLYIAGHPIRGLVFWVPTSGGLGLGISIMSYAGEVRVGVATDASLVPDPEGIVAGFEEELAFLEELAPAEPAAAIGAV